MDRFVQLDAEIYYPLRLNNVSFYKHLEKGEKLSLSKEIENVFVKMKNLLVNTPVLAQPDFRKPFYIVVDAPSTGIGTI